MLSDFRRAREERLDIMNIIIDKKLKKRMESIKLSPYRSFKCVPCERFTDRNGVKKDEQGVYRCLICGRPVEIFQACLRADTHRQTVTE